MSDKVSKRQNAILDILNRVNIVSVQQLSASLDVSVETIRKDLAALAAKDLVIRTHGGVGLSATNTIDYNAYYQSHMDQKLALAEMALPLVRQNGTVLFEDGSTSYAMCRTLLREAPSLLSTLTVVTNSLAVCSLLDLGNACNRLFILGGLCDSGRKATLGHFASRYLSSFHIQQVFLSPAGISPSLNIVSFTTGDAAFQMEALKCADEKILLADSTRFLSDGYINVAPLEAFDRIVTDCGEDSPSLRQMLKRGLPVTYPGRAG